ncbi:MAG: hypothetical protein ABL870_13390, partial [Sediminibacterium sp.]
MPIVNVREKRTSKPSELRINWGRGRLSGYESFYGFVAKFCKLNQLNPRQFKKYWQYLFCVKFQAKTISRSEIISQILNEPLYLVRTVFEDNCVQSQWPQYYNLGFGFHPNKLSFCPLCIDEGYHGCFHEHKSLKKCPIHQFELAQLEIPYSTKSEILDSYIVSLISLFDSNCPDWYLLNGKYRDKVGAVGNKNFYGYLGWLLSSDSRHIDKKERWIAEMGCNHFSRHPSCLNRNDYFILMEKLDFIPPIPNQISDLFVESYISTLQIEILKFCPKIISIITEAMTNFPDGDLINFFRLVKNINGENLLFLDLLYTEIEDLKKRHPLDQCDCVWGINKRFEIGSFLPGQPQFYGEFMCPYEFIIYELSEKWLNFISDAKYISMDDKQSFKEMSFYLFSGQKCVRTELADKVGYSLGGRIPIFNFKWPEETTNLLDLILLKIVQAHIGELKFWLSSIE